MEFRFETEYNQKSMTALAGVLRKTIRAKRSRRSHVFGWLVIALAVLLSLPLGDEPFTLDASTVITWVVSLILLFVLLFEDFLNGYVARKRMLAGLDKAVSIFDEEKYTSETKVGKTEWKYDVVELLAENKDYFVFVFDKNHAQVYDKQSLTGGTEEEFRNFLRAKTEKEFVRVK